MSRRRRKQPFLLDERHIQILSEGESGEIIENNVSLSEAAELYFLEKPIPLYINEKGELRPFLFADILDEISVFSSLNPDGKDMRSRIIYLSLLLQNLSVSDEYYDILVRMIK